MSDQCSFCVGKCECLLKQIDFRQVSYNQLLDTLIEGITYAYKNCPDAENKTFEEVAEWAGQHVLLTEKPDER